MSDYATRAPSKTAAKPADASLRPAQPGAWRAPAARPVATRPLPAAKTTAPAVVAPAKAPAPPAVAPNVVAATLEAALDWMPDVLRKKVSAGAQDFDGYPLLTLLLGYDLFTHKTVARTPQALLEALLRFSDEGTQLYQAVVKSGVLTQAGQLIRANAERFHLGSGRVLGLLDQILAIYHRNSLGTLLWTPSLLLEPLRSLGRDVLRFASAVGPPLLELILPVLGPRAQDVIKLLKKGQATFKQILRNPKAFLNNLVDGVKLGFRQFADNAAQHLAHSFMDWLLGSFKEDGVRVPKPLDMAGMFQLGLQLLGLTYDNLRAKLVKRMGKRGEAVMGALETAAGLVRTLVTKGPRAVGQELLDMASAQLGKLKDQVLDGLRGWLQKTLLLEGVKQLASLLTPATALLESLHKAYTTVVFFIERAERFQRLLTTIVDAFADIANRVLKPAADKVEGTLGQLLTLALDFFMRLIGLKDVPKQVKAQLLKARTWIDQTIDKYLDKFIEWAVKAFNKGKQVAKKAVGKIKGWLGFRQPFETPTGERHTLYVKGTEEHAELMVASTPQTASAYLEERLKEAKEETQIKLIERAQQELEALSDTTPSDDRALRLRAFAELLAQIGGVAEARVQKVLVAQLPKEAEWSSNSNTSSKEASVEKLSVKSAHSGTDTDEDTGLRKDLDWLRLKAANLTQGSKWVQMHLISAGVGGKAKANNLVPAPGSSNVGGKVRNFEEALKRLVQTPLTDEEAKEATIKRDKDRQREANRKGRQNIKPLPPIVPEDPAEKTNLVWATTKVDFYNKEKAGGLYPKDMTLEAGLYYFLDGAWMRDGSPRLQATLSGIDPPDFTGTKPLALNKSGEDSLANATGCSKKFTRLVAQELKKGDFDSPFDIRKRMKKHYVSHEPESAFTENMALLVRALRAGSDFVVMSLDDRLKKIAEEADNKVVGQRIILN